MAADSLDAAFEGFERETRDAGVRNAVLVLPSVICSGVVAESIADAVPAAVSAPHDHGCGQIGADKDQTRRTLLNVASNPNIAGAVVVGLGCETLDSGALAADLDIPVRQTAIQTAGGTDEAIAAGVEAAEELVADARGGSREPVPLSELTVGVVASDLSEPTVENASPAVGGLVRRVLDAGGNVVVGGTEALVPHRERAAEFAGEGVESALADRLSERANGQPTHLRRAAAGRDADAVTGLWDGAPITELLDYGEAAESGGVSLLDTDAGFEGTATALAAAGAQVVVHVTGDGIPTGHPVVPVLKVTGDASTAAALADDIDVDASENGSEELVAATLAAVNGERTAAERHGLRSFAIARAGPSL